MEEQLRLFNADVSGGQGLAAAVIASIRHARLEAQD
jgi:hypothetical protein